MQFTTLPSLERQSRIPINTIASWDGSVAIGQRITITGIEIITTGATSSQSLIYDPLLQAFKPGDVIANAQLISRIVTGMQVAYNPLNKLSFNVSSGIYQIGTSATTNQYIFTATTAVITSGDPTYGRYDILYVTGGTGTTSNTVYVGKGVASAEPRTIPTQPQNSVLLGIIDVPSGLTATGSSSPTIITISIVDAKYVSFQRGVYKNVSDFLDGDYVYPKINSFTNTISPLQSGNSASTLTFNWNVNKYGYTTTLTSPLSGYTYSSTTFSATLTGQTITGNSTSSAYTYTLTFNDGVNTTTLTAPVYFYNKLYFGSFSGTSITSAQITGLTGGNAFFSARTYSNYVDGSGGYLYFCYPASYGTAIFFMNGMLSNDFTVTTQSFTNPYGYTESYYIVRSNNIMNGTGIKFQIE